MTPPFWSIIPSDPLLQELAELFIKTMMAELRGINLGYELHDRRFGKELRLKFQTTLNDETIIVEHKVENIHKMSRTQIEQLARLTAVMIAQTFGERTFLSPVRGSNE